MNVSVFRWDHREVPTELGSSKKLITTGQPAYVVPTVFWTPTNEYTHFHFFTRWWKKIPFPKWCVVLGTYENTQNSSMWHNTTYISFYITASAPSPLWFVALQEDDLWTKLLPSKQLQLTKVKALLFIINIWDQVHISTYTVLQLSVLILKYCVCLATNQQCSYICDTGMLLTYFTFPTVLLG